MNFSHLMPRIIIDSLWCAALWSCAMLGAHADSVAQPTLHWSAPVRFVLTFDDGPDGHEKHNSTASILDTLADNPTQKGIRAVFFVQTRSKQGGATTQGRALLDKEHAQDHVLALHDGSTLQHPNHCRLTDAELARSLNDGMADLLLIANRPVTLLRPPYWVYNERSLAAYEAHDLAMLLTDISANDGKTWGFHASPRRRSHMASELKRVRDRIQRGDIPEVDDATPIVVTFHDLNDYTAAHLAEYLQMLVDEARKVGLTFAVQPFYASSASLERAALARAHDAAHRADMMPNRWRWLQRFCE
jgi:peptidoglycan/xylan/chitin deacetylase (PgdA/CDA1 family)